MDCGEYSAASERYRKRIEEELISIRERERARIFPKLHEAMFYSLEAGGKRLRPVLMLAVCEMLGGDPERALPFACALEMIHTYSLIHDDLPCMDDDDMRRGRPSNHKAFGEANALLAGDALLALAFEIMTDALSKSMDPGEAKAAREIAIRSGAGGMLTGQAADKENEKAAEKTEEMLVYIHERKTADMLAAAILSGAYLAGADEETAEALRRYSADMGLLFQITDDLLDLFGDEKLVGKTLGKDEAEGKLTYPSIYGVEGARMKAKEAAERAKASVKEVDRNGFLTAVIDNMLVRSR